MSKFSYLRVIARSSTAQYAQRTVDVRTAAKELGARYVMEGSIRQAGAESAHCGATSGRRVRRRICGQRLTTALYSPEAMLDLLDDVVPRIVSTIGDTQGILVHSMTEVLRHRDPESFTPYEAVLRSFGYHYHVSAEEHLAANRSSGARGETGARSGRRLGHAGLALPW